MISTDWIAAIASAISALGGGAAAVAAFRSAKSAHEALRAANEIELRTRLREISDSVAMIEAELLRNRSLARRLEKVYSDLAMFNGAFGGSRHEQVRQHIAERLSQATDSADTARPFSNGTSVLENAPPEDADRVLRNLTLALTRLRLCTAEFETELQSAEAERALHQQVVLGQRH